MAAWVGNEWWMGAVTAAALADGGIAVVFARAPEPNPTAETELYQTYVGVDETP